MRQLTSNQSALLAALFVILGMGVGMSQQSFGLEFEKVKLMSWKRGETIAGEDFIAANEAVADFLKTLPRPSEPFKGIKFECLIKSRWIRPSVQQTGATTPYNSYVNIHTVYEIKNCNPVD